MSSSLQSIESLLGALDEDKMTTQISNAATAASTDIEAKADIPDDQGDDIVLQEIEGVDDMKVNDESKDSGLALEQCDIAQMFNGYVNDARIYDLRDLKQYQQSHIHTAIHLDTAIDSVDSAPKKRNICFDSTDSTLDASDYKKLFDRFRALNDSSSFKLARDHFDFDEFQSYFPFLCTSSKDGSGSPKRLQFPNLILLNELYLGDMWDRRNPETLKLLGITHIVDATLETFKGDGTFIPKVLKIRLPDTPQAAQQMAGHFEKAIQFIDDALQNKKHRVFVHCQMGISRSTTLILAFLMKARGYTLYEGYSLCQRNRPRIRPNDGFYEQLKLLEKQVHGKSTAELIEKEMLRDMSECLIM